MNLQELGLTPDQVARYCHPSEPPRPAHKRPGPKPMPPEERARRIAAQRAAVAQRRRDNIAAGLRFDGQPRVNRKRPELAHLCRTNRRAYTAAVQKLLRAEARAL